MKRYLVCCGVCLMALAIPLLTGCNGDDEPFQTVLTFAQDPDDMQIWLMNTDGSNKRVLVAVPDVDVLQGSISPDGRSLLYQRYLEASTDMVERDLRTNTDRIVYSSSMTQDDMTPAYSPDGSLIAFSLENNNLQIINVDGTGLRPLTNDAVDITNISPGWNSNGTLIVFDNGWNGNLVIVNAFTGVRTPLRTEDATFEYMHPSFLPDGRVLFVRRDKTTSNQDVMVINADGTNEINLTPNTPDSDEFSPTSNQQGTLIFFSTDRNAGQQDIYVANFDGSSLSNLVNLTADVNEDSWRPKFGVLNVDYINGITD